MVNVTATSHIVLIIFDIPSFDSVSRFHNDSESRISHANIIQLANTMVPRILPPRSDMKDRKISRMFSEVSAPMFILLRVATDCTFVEANIRD